MKEASPPHATMVDEEIGMLLHRKSSEDALASDDWSTPLLEPARESIVGRKQSGQYYRDKWFAVAFLLQLAAVVLSAVILGPRVEAEDEEVNKEDQLNMPALKALLVLMPVLAMMITLGVLKILITQTTANLVNLSFFGFTFWSVVSFLVFDANASEDFFYVVIYLFFIIRVYLFYKPFIPFAAANFKVALTAVQAHASGLFSLALATLLGIYIWLGVWCFAVVGVLYEVQKGEKVPCYSPNASMPSASTNNNEEDQMCDPQPNVWILTGLLFCLFWTQQVLKNLLHTTTAGTVGSWWFSAATEGRSGCCSTVVRDSWARASTYSFGSICFGSLVVAVLQTLEALARNDNRNNRRNGGDLVTCVVHCILWCVRRWVEYLSSWAFCYVGLYGYDFVTSGKKVMSLFQYRGWTSFVADRLVFRVLGLIYFSAGILTGWAAVAFDAVQGPIFADTQGASAMSAFLLGLFLGTIMSSTALFVVESAVRTVIVCFAESPKGLADHHPSLFSEMTSGWREAYPDVFAHCDGQEEGTEIPEAKVLVSGTEVKE